jgi:hypothetical protein
MSVMVQGEQESDAEGHYDCGASKPTRDCRRSDRVRRREFITLLFGLTYL